MEFSPYKEDNKQDLVLNYVINFVFEVECYVAQIGLKQMIELKISPNSLSPSLSLELGSIIGEHCHTGYL